MSSISTEESLSQQDALRRMTPRFILGTISPPANRRAHLGPGFQLYKLVPNDVMEVTVQLGISEFKADDVEQAMPNFWSCVELLAAEGVHRIVLGGAPVSAQLGRTRVTTLLQEVQGRTGIRADATIEAVIAAMKHLGLLKIAVASRWADDLNGRLADYLREGGIQVIGMTSRDQWAAEAFGMSFQEGLQTALDVGIEAARSFPEAEAVWIAGGAALSLHVIPAIEERFGKTALTNLSALVWHGLVHPGIIPPPNGWGRLLSAP